MWFQHHIIPHKDRLQPDMVFEWQNDQLVLQKHTENSLGVRWVRVIMRLRPQPLGKAGKCLQPCALSIGPEVIHKA